MPDSSSVRTVTIGHRSVNFPSDQLGELEDSSHLRDDVPALLERFEEKGYLFIRGFHDRSEVLTARQAVLQYVANSGNTLSSKHPLGDGVLREGCGLGCIPFMEGRNPISHCPEVIKVLEGERPFKFFERLFGESVKTFDYKWLRAMHSEGFTGAHVDNVYMSRGSKRLLTMWTPVGDTPVEMGVLAVCEGSHRLQSFQKFQETYGNMDAESVNLNGTGWFTEDPFEITEKFGGQWKTADFKAGDVLIFGMRTVHMSTTNMTHFARVSCDTRWQPASDPVDPRFCGESFQKSGAKFGLLSKTEEVQKELEETKTTTIDELKVSWGL